MLYWSQAVLLTFAPEFCELFQSLLGFEGVVVFHGQSEYPCAINQLRILVQSINPCAINQSTNQFSIT